MSHLTTTESKAHTRGADSFSFHKLKCLLENSFPESCEALRERWYEHVSHQMLKSIAAQHGLAVQSGPFQGMQYLAELLSSKKVIQFAVLPKILGCFEAGLHGVLKHVVG